ncbi:PAP1-domain-containing protein [Terfezia boudieri ATCC MYA-4762]|uniref:PAP1-domain-containing protein n=1 Tax=Terfezia boudieri ATCC MYA-4762 TaxID=1051890 RepID=A0A3N4LNG9_9PEZI|nr:PAP1-domain-containing protein [Terfezia boudieri ATCC MYA-4762]
MASVNPLYLDPEQQDLLLAALASNSSSLKNSQNQQSRTHGTSKSHEMDMTRSDSIVGFQTPLTELNGVSPVLDGLDYTFDLDGNYDWDQGMGEEYGASVDGSIDTPAAAATEHEKRKSPLTDNENGSPGSDARQNEPKRRETDEKVAKKPGRKPLTSEPTSKRKAQNRAAQRAFRERKEKHLKDLEQKVADLEKASETANKENSALRQQIERLQVELNEYRKRLTDNKSSVSSILGKGTNGGFQFEFPLFGLKTPAHFGIGSNTKPGHFPQPNNATNGMRFDTGSQGGRARSSTNPSSVASTIRPQNKDSTSEYIPDGVRISKGESTTSPSCPSLSHPGTNSCMTSPESNSHSPLSYKQDQREPATEEIVQVLSSENDEPGFHCGVLDDGETSFCEKLGAIACGNPRNPIPLDPDSKLLPNLNKVIPRPDPRRTHQVGSRFDPVLFRDYRDPMDQANMDLNMSFFDDAFPMADFSLGSPIIPGTPVGEKAEPELKKPAPAGLENTEDDDSGSEDEAFIVKAKPDANLMSCNKIWDRISAHPKFASGELDMDNLCSELRSKAKCSETGVVVGQKDVEEALSKAGLKPRDFGIVTK